MELVEAVSAPGTPGSVNDDAHCFGPMLAAVLDGATGPGEPLIAEESDAAWLAHQTVDRMGHYAQEQRGAALLRAALEDVEAEFLVKRRRAPEAPYEVPMASLMMCQPMNAAALGFWWLGDCTGLVLREDSGLEIVGDALRQRSGEAAHAASMSAPGAGPASQKVRAEFLAALRQSRNRYNRTEGPWILSPSPACAEHAKSAVCAVTAGTLVLLATDGFFALASDYLRYEPASLMKTALDRGLPALVNELRQVELADEDGRRYPRFKTSDDATAVLIRCVD